MSYSYWNKKIETASREEIECVQLTRLKEIIRACFQTSFYQHRFKSIGLNSVNDISLLADLKKIPFAVKDDLRQSYPTGLLSTSFDEVVRVHASSGTTGIPTVIYLTQDDLNAWSDIVARSVYSTGVRKSDVFQNMMSYGLFTGGLGLHYGAERVGCMIIPAGGGNTKRQIKLMKDFGTTVIHITPSYLLHIYNQLPELGERIENLKIKKAFLGAEPYSENTKTKLEELFQIDVYNSYGLSEMNGPGVAFECVEKKGMHVWEDAYILEIIDPTTGEPLPDGQEGEVVLTNLTRKATPLLRYRTRDLAYVYTDTCACGRKHRRISRITGRTDDMLIINGVNVFPSQIEEVVMRIPEVGTNYQIYLTKKGAIDVLTVKVEIYSKMFHGEIRELDLLKERMRNEIAASITIKPKIELHEPGALPSFEGKGQRVIDNRERL